jgi:hypothetical protein
MGWPIHVGEPVQPEARPSWKRWALLFVGLAGVGAAWAVWSWPHGKPVDLRFWLRAAVTPLLVGCVLLGLRLNRYEQSVAASVAHDEATGQTKHKWQQWAQQALTVTACASITPERDLVAAMSSVPPVATASPHKGRKFHDWPDDGKTDPLQWAFEQLARRLDQVRPDWHGCVRSVHVQGDFEPERIESAWRGALAVVQRPSLAPVARFDVRDWENMFDEPDARPRLFVGVQAWSFSREPLDFSELAVALLVSGSSATGSVATPAAWIGRPMPTSTEMLDADLAMLLNYSEIDPGTIGRVWFTGVPPDFPGTMKLSASLSHGSTGVSSYLIDHYLGPAHIAQYWFALAAASEIQANGNPQLVIGHAAKGLTIHLITGPTAAHPITA